MSKRMGAALLSLAGVFVALYLALYKLGYIGTLACAVGSCEAVQTSRWATLFGMPVALWGVVYYAGVLVATLVGLSGPLADSPRFARGLVVVTASGVLFSLWLTYLELFVIHAICMWCVISAVLASLLCLACWLDMREVTALSDDSLATAAARQLRGPGFGNRLRNTSEVSIRAISPEDGPA